MRANEEYLDYEALVLLLEELRVSSAELDRGRVRQALVNIVAGYEPSNGIDDLIWMTQQNASKETESTSIIEFPARSA